jgi:hypothetical protein
MSVDLTSRRRVIVAMRRMVVVGGTAAPDIEETEENDEHDEADKGSEHIAYDLHRMLLIRRSISTGGGEGSQSSVCVPVPFSALMDSFRFFDAVEPIREHWRCCRSLAAA